ncbi:alpha/beta fold hydrolase [Lignipirellula cremea]|uniref:Alpha/beta hydrolase family protein n=1 Tax=Lignipirellula cremea TaxID=2528010 RepID=A0A518DM43_9BACT|nr:alpha/beta fold hydrolase [Lignipirellula cremea]QDU92910.1 Alpha/beta hydrolase family protein [Lignipirellula cremea]
MTRPSTISGFWRRDLRLLLRGLGLMVVVLSTGCASLQHTRELTRRGWEGFAGPLQNPDATAPLGLTTDRGYEPGKIPVIMIHGLLSDAMTWNEPIRALREDEAINSRYQFWTYRYLTGETYLKTAADFRAELIMTLEGLDPQRQDPLLHQVVLVGHSMGGLIAKLQVAASGDDLWQTITAVPLDQTTLAPADREQLAGMFYFAPQIRVQQAVFIATPHRGSEWTQRPLARLGRRFIEFPQEMKEEYDRWLVENQAILKHAPAKIPTSIDHLDPDNPILLATARLPVAPQVKLHSIIGQGHRLPDGSPGDGVVSIASAQIPGVASELFVEGSHSGLHHQPETIAQLKRILLQDDSQAPDATQD